MASRIDEYYSHLMEKFKNKNNILNLISAKMGRFDDIDLLLDGLLNHRDVDSSEGVHLDLNGHHVGIMKRPNEFISASNIFTLKANPADPDDPNKGFASTSAETDGGYWQAIDGAETDTPMSDLSFRKYVLAKGRYLFERPSIVSLYDFIYSVFGFDCGIEVTGFKQVTITPERELTSEERYMVYRLAPIAACENIVIAWT